MSNPLQLVQTRLLQSVKALNPSNLNKSQGLRASRKFRNSVSNPRICTKGKGDLGRECDLMEVTH